MEPLRSRIDTSSEEFRGRFEQMERAVEDLKAELAKAREGGAGRVRSAAGRRSSRTSATTCRRCVPVRSLSTPTAAEYRTPGSVSTASSIRVRRFSSFRRSLPTACTTARLRARVW